jgi:hypothetical protein
MKVNQAVAQAAVIGALGLATGALTAPATVEAGCLEAYCEQDIIWDDCIYHPQLPYTCELQPTTDECYTVLCS